MTAPVTLSLYQFSGSLVGDGERDKIDLYVRAADEIDALRETGDYNGSRENFVQAASSLDADVVDAMIDGGPWTVTRLRDCTSKGKRGAVHWDTGEDTLYAGRAWL